MSRLPTLLLIVMLPLLAACGHPYALTAFPGSTASVTRVVDHQGSRYVVVQHNEVSVGSTRDDRVARDVYQVYLDGRYRLVGRRFTDQSEIGYPESPSGISFYDPAERELIDAVVDASETAPALTRKADGSNVPAIEEAVSLVTDGDPRDITPDRLPTVLRMNEEGKLVPDEPPPAATTAGQETRSGAPPRIDPQ